MEQKEILKLFSDFRKQYYDSDETILKKKIEFPTLQKLRENLDPSQFRIDLHGYRFECLFQRRDCLLGGDNLYVIYNGARYTDLPEFPRWGYHRLFSGSTLCLEDPMPYKYPSLNLGWFYGTEEESLIELSLKIVRAVCDHEKIPYENVIFFSSSGGGYAGIYAASLLHGTLAIALNPQIYIQNYVHTQNFIKNTGIDLAKPDALHRNDIPYCLKESRSKYVILFNVQSKRDWDTQVDPFMREMGILPIYGITEMNNVLFWLYDCEGAPDPHTSFETKSIFCFIDYVAKKFFRNQLTEKEKKVALIINECWHDIYHYKLESLKVSHRQDFSFLGFGRDMEDNLKMDLLDEKQDIMIPKQDSNFNFFRYNITKGKQIYHIVLNGVEADFLEYTVGVFDFKNNKILHYETCTTSEPTNFCFAVGEQLDEIAFLVYAGVFRHTKGQEIKIRKLSVYSRKLS